MIAGRRLCPALIPGLYTLGFLLLWIPAGLSHLLSDDFSLVRNIQTGGMFGIWSGAGSRFFRPVISLSIYLDHLLWGVEPLGYHLTNLLFHLTNSVLIYFLVLELQIVLSPDDRGVRDAARATALLFLILPSHGEAIFWIAARTDLIATVFFQISLIAFLRALQSSSVIPILISWTAAVIAYLSKESTIALVPLCIAITVLRRHPGDSRSSALRTVIICSGGHLVLLAAFWTWRSVRIGEWIGGYGTDAHIPLLNPAKLINLPVMMCRSVLPYQSNQIVFGLSVVIVCMFVLAGALRLAPDTRRIHRQASIRCALLLAISLIPVFPLGTSITDTQGERLVYAPSLFSVCLLSFFLNSSEPGKTSGRLNRLIPILCLAFLARSSVMYAQAGQLSQKIVSELCSLEPANLALINLPDNLRGAYVFRSCLPDALILGCDRQVVVTVCCTHPIDSRNTRIDCDLDSRGLTLRFPAKWMTRPDFKVLPGRSGDTPATVSGNQLRIEWDALPTDAIPIMYSAGSLHRLRRPGVLSSASVITSPMATLEVANH